MLDWSIQVTTFPEVQPISKMHIFQVQSSVKMVKTGDVRFFPVPRNEKQTGTLHTRIIEVKTSPKYNLKIILPEIIMTSWIKQYKSHTNK